MSAPSIIRSIQGACTKGLKITVAHYNIHSFNLSMQLPWFYEFLQSAEITHCDGMGILKAVRSMGLDLPLEYRVSYSVLMPKLLKHCQENNLSLFLLGTTPEHLGKAIAAVQKDYPTLRVDGHHGFFGMDNPEENGAVIGKINQFKPNVLVVGMGMPRQERWIYQNRVHLDVNVIMPGGAIIDRLAGHVPDCPPLIANMGLEWAYRLTQEPGRLGARYLFGNPAFAFHIALAKTLSTSLEVQIMQPIEQFKREVSSTSADWYRQVNLASRGGEALIQASSPNSNQALV
ncbi:MAG: WecB/TagA/CpsF family glycosyltransferase [Leptolyngbyaceae cyanobacterium bins.59]|nr:WecB/TagA/CpsF family glycosyltransferase [Leptolyngbyaceae cyanobacterium bins.59]